MKTEIKESHQFPSKKQLKITINTCEESHAEYSSLNSEQLLLAGPKCLRCPQLQLKIIALQLELKKLEQLLYKGSDHSKEPQPEQARDTALPQTNTKRSCKTPRNDQNTQLSFGNFTIDWEAQKQMLRSLEEKAERLCQKERKERKILKQFIADRESLKSSKKQLSYTGKIDEQPKIETQKHSRDQQSKEKKHEGLDRVGQLNSGMKDNILKLAQQSEIQSQQCSQTSGMLPKITEQKVGKARSTIKKAESLNPLSLSAKLQTLQHDTLDDLLSNSMVGLGQSEVSDISGLSSSPSERKSMLEGMTKEQIEAYYSKNIKNRKIMAKLKRKK